jgi:hypothetical protein
MHSRNLPPPFFISILLKCSALSVKCRRVKYIYSYFLCFAANIPIAISFFLTCSKTVPNKFIKREWVSTIYFLSNCGFCM